MFDKEGNGYLSVPDLRHVLTQMGEKLSDPEVDELLQSANYAGESSINYKDFARMMLAR